MIQSISDGVVTVDSNWRITCFNRAAEQIIGISRSKALGQHCYEVLKSNTYRDACPLQYTIETGQPVVDLTVYLANADGIKVPVSICTPVFRGKRAKASNMARPKNS